MAKVKYTKCDVCDCQIQNDCKSPYYKKGFRLFIGALFHYDMIDICDDCLMKIRQMKRDVNLEDMVCNEVIDQAFTKHSDPPIGDKCNFALCELHIAFFVVTPLRG